VAIGVSLSAIYIPVLSDSEELLINTLNSASGNILGNDMNFSLPLVSLLQGELDKDYFAISSNTGASLTSPENTVKIPTINLPATVVPTITPTTPSTDPTKTDTTPNTDKDTSAPDTEKNSSIKKPIPNYKLDYHQKYHRHYHQIHHPKKISRDNKN
jgi:hypothetical protein